MLAPLDVATRWVVVVLMIASLLLVVRAPVEQHVRKFQYCRTDSFVTARCHAPGDGLRGRTVERNVIDIGDDVDRLRRWHKG